MSDDTKNPVTDPAERLARIHALLGAILSTATSHDVLELAMATAISQRLTSRETPPVWLMFVGPPSVGKTAGADFLRDTEAAGLTRFVNSASRGALDSGLVDAKGQKAPWLLAELDGRCWVNTELNALLNEDDRAVQKIMGTLSSAFDGSYAKSVGTATGSTSSIRRVKSRFTIIGCVTPETLAKHSQHMRDLGPRFLMYRVSELAPDEESRGFDLVRDTSRRPGLVQSLRGMVREHLTDALARAETTPVTIPMNQERILELLSRLVVAGRTSVWRERETGDLVRGEAEGPFRAYQQLRSLLLALAYVHGTATPSPRALRLVRDVALSSVLPIRAEVLLTQRQAPAVAVTGQGGEEAVIFGLTVARLADVTGWSLDRAERALTELVMVGLYEPRPDAQAESGPRGGRPPTFYAPVQGLAVMLRHPFEGLAEDLSNLSPIDLPWARAFQAGLVQAGLDEGSSGEVFRHDTQPPGTLPRESGVTGSGPAPHVCAVTENPEGSEPDPYAEFDTPCQPVPPEMAEQEAL